MRAKRKMDAEKVDDRRRRLLERKSRNFTATPAELLELFWMNNP